MMRPDGPLIPRRCEWRCRGCSERGYDDPRRVGQPRWTFFAHWRAMHAPRSIWTGTYR